LTTPKLIEHFFRHEYGKLVATLSARVGVQYLEIVEDSVQSALMAGLEFWTIRGLPDNPSAWLYKVATNKLISELRQRSGRDRVLSQNAEDSVSFLEITPEYRSSKELQDDMLRMLFVCCNDAIPRESQLVFALKTLCGFSIREIALRLFISEANAYKRFSRSRSYLKKSPLDSWELNHEEYSLRLPSVNKVLYLIFTEGYLSVNHEISIRQELCEEAIRLATILANHETGQTPETFALLALMHFHLARLSARQDSSGGLLLLEQQDRSLWDKKIIQAGLAWLEKSSCGENFSRYHAEAGIAAEHCLAPSFHQTRWDRIAENYLLLEQAAPSAIHRLNRAVAVAEWQGPAAGLAVLKSFEPPSWLVGSYLWSAVLADLYQRNGNMHKAKAYRDDALKSAPTPALKTLLLRRLKIDSID